jgi:drug/metabolite transporter (DMT)-like permease
LFLLIHYISHHTYDKKILSFSRKIVWEEHIRQKIMGYVFRIGAILLFGSTPVVAKYFLSDIPNGLAITSVSALGALAFLSPVLVYKIGTRQWGKVESYSKYFWIILLFETLFFISYFFSVHFTSASNASLLLTLGPVIAIIFAFLFFREKIVYFQTKNNARAIISIFILGALGASFLVLNKEVNIVEGSLGNKIFGDFLAILAVLFDVIATIFLILYAKSKNAFSGLDYILRKITLFALILSPIAIYTLLNYSFSGREIIGILFIGIGYFVLGFGFAYEAFRRLDGFINYLLMNVGQLFTVVLEVWFFDLPLTFLFILGAIFILVSSIAAEYINTKCEKKMVKAEGGEKNELFLGEKSL